MVSVRNPAPGATVKSVHDDTADQRQPLSTFRAAWTVLAATLAAAGGVAQLLVDGTGRILLGIVGLAAITALCSQWARVRAGRAGRLTLELATAMHALRLYRSAIQRIIARQLNLFEEEVEITVTIGAQDGQDAIVERHRTSPKPFLVYRLIRPITASTSRVRPGFAELGLVVAVDGDDRDASALPLSEDAEGVQIMILFTPGLSAVTEWSLSYRAPRLWDLLRQDGFDKLCWAPSDREGRETTIAVTDLVVHFVFPADARHVDVREQRDRGTTTVGGSATAERRVTWRDESPTVQPYRWELWCSR